jgi:hypothetical protein
MGGRQGEVPGLTTSEFWNRRLQNWQSEFLAVGSMSVLLAAPARLTGVRACRHAPPGDERRGRDARAWLLDRLAHSPGVAARFAVAADENVARSSCRVAAFRCGRR